MKIGLLFYILRLLNFECQLLLGDKWYIYFFPEKLQRDCSSACPKDKDVPMYEIDTVLQIILLVIEN